MEHGAVIELWVGDCREVLAGLASESVNCIITSPPYFGLRDYDMAAQLGLESSPAEFVSNLVGVLREARRVLRSDGTLWLNLGDSYAGSGRGGNPTAATSTLEGSQTSQEASIVSRRPRLAKEVGATARTAAATGHTRLRGSVKSKSLLGMPWRVAFALQDDGWILRQDIIWHKPNPMPESVRDRCTKSHEYMFLFSKAAAYYFDQAAIKEPVTLSTVARLSQPGLADQAGSDRVPGKTNGRMKAVGHLPGNKTHKGTTAYEGGDEKMRTKAGLVAYCERVRADPSLMAKRNKRSVWTIATRGFKGSHFATFPPALVEPCVLAGCPVGGTVLDPFAGAGTTGLVARQHGRASILIELNPEYAQMAADRLNAAGQP